MSFRDDEKEPSVLLSARSEPPVTEDDGDFPPEIESHVPSRQRYSRDGLFSRHIDGHGGQELPAPKGEVLAKFDSMVEAVRCAVAVQREIAEIHAGADLSDDREYRIGINWGHFDVENEDILRRDTEFTHHLRDNAEPGGLWMSATIGTQITQRLGKASLAEDDTNDRKPWALALQVSLLAGYFLFWAGLILWRTWYTAVHKVAPCIPSFMCD